MPKGQSIQEYLLPLGLIVVVAIASLTMLGQNLSGIFSGMVQKAPPPAPVIVDAGFPAGPNTSTFSFPITRSDGTVATITIPNFPNNLATAIETSGPNGSTEKMLAFLNQLADTLLAEGAIKADQAQAIRDIASSGLFLAKKQKDVQDALENTTGTTYDDVKIYDTSTNPPRLVSLAPINALWFVGSTNSISAARDAAQQKGALDNPIVATIVNLAAGQLSDSGAFSTSFMVNALNYRNGTVTKDTFKNTIKNESLKSKGAAKAICDAAGNSTVENITCIQASG